MILFRADGNNIIGTGHIMRCLSIAGAADNGQALFVTADGAMSQVIRPRFENIILHTDYTDLMQELDQMQDLIRICRPTALFVDSYYVTRSYLDALWECCAAVGCRLVYIDDLVSFPYPCDALINYNIYGPDCMGQYKTLYNGQTPKLFLGPSFVPLRREFQGLAPRIVRGGAHDILISTGGSDADHIALQLAEEIVSRAVHGYDLHFILGPMNADKQIIKKIAAGFTGPSRMIIHENVKNMSELMQSCDVAVSAAGSTLYELCATQTPAITYILADNQIPGAEGFERHGILKCEGDYRILQRGLMTRLVDSAVRLASDYEERKRISEKMRTVVNGSGSRRILDAILQYY